MKTRKHLVFPWLILACLLAAYVTFSGFPGTVLGQDTATDVTPIHQFPIEIVSNKPYVQVTVNESDPLWFILDTGSGQGSMIGWGPATRIGLELTGEKEAQGVGAGEGASVKTAWASGVDIDLQGRRMSLPRAMVMQLNHVSEYEGRSLDGTLGSDLLHAAVTEIDFGSKIVRLYEPSSYKYTGSGRSIPFYFLGGLPVVQASLKLPGRDSISGIFVVDTGSRMAILLNSPFVAKHRLLEAEMDFHAGTIGGGVGGESTGYVGRIENMMLGPFMVIKPVAIFSSDKSGVVASSSFDGIIGGGILARSKVIFDYSRQQFILEPYTRTPAPFEYDMSGLFLVGKGADFKQFTVLSVMDGSPADDAGLQRGDAITSLNGKDSGEFTLDQVRRLFKQEGEKFSLDISRGEEQFKVEITTRRLV